MENFSRSLSRSLSRSVSRVDANKAWRRTTYGQFDGGKSMKTVRLGEHNDGGFSKIIKKMFNFTKSKNHESNTLKARRSAKIASSSEAFQNRLLTEIYKSGSSNDELRSS